MNKTLTRNTVAAMLCATIFLGGCATQQGNDQLMGAGAGAVGGAALGCLTGFLASGRAGGCATGAAIGAAVGAVAGWGAVKMSQYQAAQVRTAQDDQRLYGLAKSVSTTQVKINKGSSTPATVKPGDMVQLNTDYSVNLPRGMQSTQVSESWSLKKDGKGLAALPAQTHERAAGGWNIDGAIPIPKNASAGTYVIEHKVQAGTAYDTDESTFVVSK